MKKIFRKLWQYLILPAIILLAFMALSIFVGIRAPFVTIWMRYILIAGILVYTFFSYKKKSYGRAVFWFLVAILLSWMRWWETYLLQAKTTNLPLGFTSTLVVLSDLHLGPYKGEKYMQKIVDTINMQTWVDAVLIVGDWVYEPKPQTLESIFAPLKQIHYPVYAVLGNHDEVTSYHTINIKDELEHAIRNVGVTLLKNEWVMLSWHRSQIHLFGLWDERAWEANVTVLSGIREDDNVIVLAHNPDTIMRYWLSWFMWEKGNYDRDFFHKVDYVTSWLETVPVDITFAWHTHAGQIRLFGITNNLTPTKYRRPRSGRYEELKLFITRWVGETIVPVRLHNRVQIDIIQTH